MSGFKQCILNGIKEGLISEKQGETLYKNFDEIKDFYQYRKNLNKPEAEKKAAREVYDAFAKPKSSPGPSSGSALVRSEMEALKFP